MFALLREHRIRIGTAVGCRGSFLGCRCFGGRHVAVARGSRIRDDLFGRRLIDDLDGRIRRGISGRVRIGGVHHDASAALAAK
ncbi:MAG: hypothetical protein P1V36_16530, partial [Planctomycetota bacterium]|nr:hypothetical protein [Planctomycetota bacterium]